jgi:hypothetical protein
MLREGGHPAVEIDLGNGGQQWLALPPAGIEPRHQLAAQRGRLARRLGIERPLIELLRRRDLAGLSQCRAPSEMRRQVRIADPVLGVGRDFAIAAGDVGLEISG